MGCTHAGASVTRHKELRTAESIEDDHRAIGEMKSAKQSQHDILNTNLQHNLRRMRSRKSNPIKPTGGQSPRCRLLWETQHPWPPQIGLTGAGRDR
jgi:hypothetical protein